jgi:hypothetical protein
MAELQTRVETASDRLMREAGFDPGEAPPRQDIQFRDRAPV